MKIHLDLSSGIAGNMFLAACLDLGLDKEPLISALNTLPGIEWQLSVERGLSGGLEGTQVEVHYPHEHVHRHLSDIVTIIEGSELPPAVMKLAKQIFHKLASAEATVHGLSIDEIHFHEVGAVDAIIDICGAAYAVWALGITSVSASPLVTGSGQVRCAHGVMPVPVPAVVELVRNHAIALQPSDLIGEMATPTGVAILAQLAQRFGASELTAIDASGLGLGTRSVKGRANALRILAQHETHDTAVVDDHHEEMLLESVTVLSTHLDDMNPEWFGPLWDHLFEDGALDVALIPMTMKKGRPATRLEVVSSPDDAQRLARLILHHTTSLGVRIQPMERLIWKRTETTHQTPYGEVRVKQAGTLERLEYDDLARIATTEGWSLPETEITIRRWLSTRKSPSG
ncbi:MAG: nickel pincer cofactor biosynthesis protein LarC [Magnetococcales bacterium]|nr:nickel pincer cofactor biosynthesis protein LarC [Magnetococcales bacterium]